MLKRIKKLRVPIKSNGDRKWIVRDNSEPDEILDMEVIGYDHAYDEYLVNIPDSVAGFTISQFHILHYEVPEKLLGKRFNSCNVSRKFDSGSNRDSKV